jgi:hypothetical protein
MGKVRKWVKKTSGASLVGRIWVDIALFLLAGVIIGLGVYLWSQPEWILRTDIKEYNQGVFHYQEKLWAPLVSSEEMLISVYPHVIEYAGGRFEKAGLESTDKKLKSLASYNLGTLLGRTAFLSQRLPGTESYLVGAITNLGEAIRNDPHNEDAKFNLELLERVLEGKEEEAAGPGPGYSPGAVYTGY